jgi:hypothetical protein
VIRVHVMTTSQQPLLTLSDVRIQDESRMAAAIAAGEARYRKGILRILFACLGEYAVGLSVVGLSLHIYGGDLGAAAFYAGMLVALSGPVWTVLLSMWLEENR